MQETIELLPTDQLRGAAGEQDDLGEPQNQEEGQASALLQDVVNYCVQVKIDHIVNIMLEHHNSDQANALPPQVLEMVNLQAKEEMHALLSGLLAACFRTDEQSWFHQLQVEQPDDEHLENFVGISEALQAMCESSEQDNVTDEQLEELASLLLQVQELRTALAMSVSQQLQQAKKDYSTPTKTGPKKLKSKKAK